MCSVLFVWCVAVKKGEGEREKYDHVEMKGSELIYKTPHRRSANRKVQFLTHIRHHKTQDAGTSHNALKSREVMALYAARLDSRTHSGEFVLYFYECSLPTIAKIAHTICRAINITDTEEAYKSIHYFLSSQPQHAYIKFSASFETDKKRFYEHFSRGGFMGFVPVPWRDCLVINDVEVHDPHSSSSPSIHELREHFKLPLLLESATLPHPACTASAARPLNTLVAIPSA